MRRHELSDQQWEPIAPLFPPNGKRGGQWKDHRLLLHGILWILATGAAWRDLPERFGPWGTVYDRFRKWTRNGLWEAILQHVQVQRQADGTIDWKLFFIDGSVVRAHKAAAGARKKIPARERPDHALGRSRGGFSTKLHLVCEGRGLPLAAEIGPGQEHETQHVISLVEHLPALHAAGDQALRPGKFVGDKGYAAGWIRPWLRERGMEPVIAHRKNESRPEEFDQQTYRERNLIERCVGRWKEFRRIATRYEKLGLHYLGMLHLGMILLWLPP